MSHVDLIHWRGELVIGHEAVLLANDGPAP
jgi:hypothetical protein